MEMPCGNQSCACHSGNADTSPPQQQAPPLTAAAEIAYFRAKHQNGGHGRKRKLKTGHEKCLRVKNQDKNTGDTQTVERVARHGGESANRHNRHHQTGSDHRGRRSRERHISPQTRQKHRSSSPPVLHHAQGNQKQTENHSYDGEVGAAESKHMGKPCSGEFRTDIFVEKVVASRQQRA